MRRLTEMTVRNCALPWLCPRPDFSMACFCPAWPRSFIRMCASPPMPKTLPDLAEQQSLVGGGTPNVADYDGTGELYLES